MILRLAAAASLIGFLLPAVLFGQISPGGTDTLRIGEKVTYGVSFGRFRDVAFIETEVVSRGNLLGRDAVELRGRFKTLDFVSAAFYLIDETRTVYADPQTLMPLYTSITDQTGAAPRESVVSFLDSPAQAFDLLSLIYKVRAAGGVGTFSLIEKGKTFPVTAQVTGSERVKTDAGQFDTTIISIGSDYFTGLGFKEMRINLSADAARIPVRMRIKNAQGEFTATASAVQVTAPVPVAPIAIQPAPIEPLLPPAARPIPTPAPYINNRPLAEELAFDLGESLYYRVTVGGAPVGTFLVEAKERRQINGRDTLLLRAAATSSDPANRIFAVGDAMSAQVNPETLAPRWSEIRFTGALSAYNQTAQFDPDTGAVTFGGTNRVDAPIGTHSLLSLFYAIRSFNLRPSRDLRSPVNDTRVAVFFDNQPYIFALRPSEPEMITIQGAKVSAQMVTISTGNAVLDQLSPTVWLGTDAGRLPLRVRLGNVEAELVSAADGSGS